MREFFILHFLYWGWIIVGDPVDFLIHLGDMFNLGGGQDDVCLNAFMLPMQHHKQYAYSICLSEALMKLLALACWS